MTAAVVMFFGVCDRCNKPFRTPRFPHDYLCRVCYLGALTPVERAVALLSGAVL